MTEKNTSASESLTEIAAIYKLGGWDGMGSGPGSTPWFTAPFRKFLSGFLLSHTIRSVVDIGCGDWQWASLIEWGGIRYTGIDFVPALIEQNQKRYQQGSIRFLCEDVLEFEWPEADLVLIKDIVHHVPADRVQTLIEKSRKFPLALWVVDMDEFGVCNAPGDCYFHACKHVFEFDVTVPGYRYGRKAAILGRGLR